MQDRKRDTDVQHRLLDSVGEGEGGMFQENSMETCILSIVKQVTSPGWVHETSARAWCTGKTQRDRVGRGVGGGIGMGNTCGSMADSCHVWQDPLQYCEVISLQLIKINEKKKENRCLNTHHSTWVYFYISTCCMLGLCIRALQGPDPMAASSFCWTHRPFLSPAGPLLCPSVPPFMQHPPPHTHSLGSTTVLPSLMALRLNYWVREGK